MSEKLSIFSDQIPPPFGHFSQAIKMDNFIHISAVYPLDVTTGQLAGAEAYAQCEKVFSNIASLLQFAGATMGHIVMLRVYMVDFKDVQALEAVSKKVFFFVPPARTLLFVPYLPYGARVSAEAVVQLPAQDVKKATTRI